MVEGQIRLPLRGLDGSGAGCLEARAEDSLLTLALRLREARGPAAKCPQLISSRGAVPLHLSVAEAGLKDGEELTVAWPPAARRPAPATVSRRPELDGQTLQLALRVGSVLDLAGRAIPGALVTDIAAFPESLLSLDIRRCGLMASQVQVLFAALPVSVTEVRASSNQVGKGALQGLAAPNRQLRVLDIGDACSDVDSDDEPDLASVTALVGAKTEELGLDRLSLVVPAAVVELASLCPGLQKLDIGGCANLRAGHRAWFNFALESEARESEQCTEAWAALARGCASLKELWAHSLPCSSTSLRLLLSSCPLGVVVIEGLSLAEGDVGSFDESHVESFSCVCRTPREALAATRLDTGWLDIRCDLYDDDETAAQRLATDFHQYLLGEHSTFVAALVRSTASDLELELPFFDDHVFRAAGPRLRGIKAASFEEAGVRPTGVLKPLAMALRTQAFPNLLEIRVSYWEQLDSADVAAVAVACPLLETVMLNADRYGFQQTGIDEGVLALGKHCHCLQYLDLYDRTMYRGPSVLATACQGWPRLRYLCAAGVLPEDQDWTESGREVLAHALAAHCPALEELEICPVPAAWHAILSAGCPLLQLPHASKDGGSNDDET